MNDNIIKIIEELDKKAPHSTLAYFAPDSSDEDHYYEICNYYLNSSKEERYFMRSRLKNMKGITNNLLGYALLCVESLIETKDIKWLKIGLCSTILAEENMDYRDVLMVRAELYVTAEEFQINPDPVFNELGVKNFGNSRIVEERRDGVWTMIRQK
ncbi:MAG TPA: hypothetical protein PLE45_12235 [Spirochaetota bacterium]|nr:hypothetical protein [Spirochaetota bacterium]HPP05481.1 hypothetical protein [Spirochaetota bacterium]